MKTGLRKSGIEIIGEVPWGTHICEFYRNKEDMVDILVPYFKAGLENNEFCMWIPSEPFDKKEAMEAMQKEIPGFDKYLKGGQIEIVSYSEWYLKDGPFNAQRIFNEWIDKLKQVLARGYDGLRATGDTFWLEEKMWKGFTVYEEGINVSIDQFKMIALCLYPIEKCNASEILEVVSNHPIVIIRQENRWKLIESSERKRLEGKLRKYNDELETRIQERTAELLTTNEALKIEISRCLNMENALRNSEENFRSLAENANDGIIINVGNSGEIVYVNRRLTEMTGYSIDEMLKTSIKDHAADDRFEEDMNLYLQIMEGIPSTKQHETAVKRKDGTILPVEMVASKTLWKGLPALTVIIRDISERKKREEILWNTSCGVSSETGDSFFVSLVQYLGKTLHADYALIGKLAGENKDRVMTIAVYAKGKVVDNFEYKLEGTPCMNVVGRDSCCYPQDVQRQFPGDILLAEMGIESYVGAPLFDSKGDALGLIVVLDTKPMKEPDMSKSILQIFAIRASSEMERCRMEEEKLQYERKLLQAQKMQALGKLTGGIAHDFNNILTVLVGYGTLLMMKRKEDNLTRDYAGHILALSEKAAKLTKGLLAFSSQQVMNLSTINLNELVKGIDRIISRLVREDIKFKTCFPKKNLIIRADSSQIEQVLMNLLVNAFDAMPNGGCLTLSIESLTSDEEFIKIHGCSAPGEYACISVSDTGTGMDKETKRKIFEPFFTTKEVGKGTGLGLSIVYGVVQQHNGYINVYSEHGKGTTFKIYLPIAKLEAEQANYGFVEDLPKGTETILVADDDAEVTMLTKTIFQESGYNVILARDGEDAINKFKANQDKIQLLVLDVIMPKKNGKEAYEEIKNLSPLVKVIFTSGYTEDIISQKMVLEEGLNFITKPIMPTELLKRVREVLDS